MTRPTIIRDQTGSTAAVVPEAGFTCVSFAPVIAGAPVETLWADPEFGPASPPALSGIPLLFPFCGRLRGQRFTWRGTTYDVPGALTDDGNAMHGFVLNRPWRVVARSDDRLTGEFQASIDDPALLTQWPADFRIAVTYRVAGAELICDVTIANPDRTPLPFGFGTHPYFRLPAAADARAACRITVPATACWERAGGYLTGRVVPIDPNDDLRAGPALGDREPEGIFTHLASDGDEVETRIEDPACGRRVVQRFDVRFRACVVYTLPGRQGIALEPWLAVPDLFTLAERGIDSGLQVLAPGERFTARIVIRAEETRAGGTQPARLG